MPKYDVSYNKITKVAVVREDGEAVPQGFVAVGEIELPDADYPEYLLYHKVRDVLYQRSAADPAVRAMFPDNITDMANITIRRM